MVGGETIEYSERYSSRPGWQKWQLSEKLVDILRGSSKDKTILSLSDKLTRFAKKEDIDNTITPDEVATILTDIRQEGIHLIELKEKAGKIHYTLSTEPRSIAPIEFEYDERWHELFPEGRVKFAAISNTEFGHRYSRNQDALPAFYEILKRENVNLVFHCGDILAGEEKAKTREEIEIKGLENQVTYLLKNYPKVDGIHTMFITAPDCEGTFIKSRKMDVGAFIERQAKKAGRNDLSYLGHLRQYVHIPVPDNEEPENMKKMKKAVIQLGHLSGKVPYARSYPAQKIVQSLQGGTKPHVLLLGHLMQFEDYLDREIWSVQVGGFKDQSPSMQSDRQHSDVGGYIIELWQPRPGEEVFSGEQFAMEAETIPFFNRAHYEKNNRYGRRSKK